MPDSLLRMAMARAQGESQAADRPLLRALYRQAEGAALAISEFPRELGAEARARMPTSMAAALRERYPAAQVQPSRYRHGTLEIAQVMLHDSTQVVFKLLVDRPGAPLYQLDYVVPRPIYRRELESVESSIGSLQSRS